MRDRQKLALTLALLALPAALLVAGCNKSIDDPDTAENQVTVAAVNPDVACVDVDGTQQSGDGGTTTYYQDAVNSLTFQSRVRGSVDTQDSVWNDVIFDTIDFTYVMNDGGPTPAPWTDRPAPAITVKANSTVTVPLVTVPVADIGPGAPLDTAGRLGVVSMVFKGHDAAGQPATTSVRIPIATYTQCQVGGGV